MNAWEITPDDVANVLRAHGCVLSDDKVEDILEDLLDHDAIIDNLLHHASMEEQVESCYSDIEDALIEDGVISGPKKFGSKKED